METAFLDGIEEAATFEEPFLDAALVETGVFFPGSAAACVDVFVDAALVAAEGLSPANTISAAERDRTHMEMVLTSKTPLYQPLGSGGGRAAPSYAGTETNPRSFSPFKANP